MSANMVGFALLLLALMLFIGKVMRIRIKVTQKLFLPASIMGGFVALLLGPEVLGMLGGTIGGGVGEFIESGGVFGEEVLSVWKTLPGLLISVVFATPFLGQKLPGPKSVNLAGPQLAVGVAFASGQYVVGPLLAVAVLTPLFGMTPMAGALIEIGFEGGHGTAAHDPVFEDLGWSEGADLQSRWPPPGRRHRHRRRRDQLGHPHRRTEVVTEVRTADRRAARPVPLTSSTPRAT